MPFERPRGGFEGGDGGEAVGATQASNLPATIDIAIPEIEKLRDYKDWDYWLQRVKCALEMMDLNDLISAHIPRPTENDDSYAKWRKAAKAVRFWLLSSISKDILTKVMNTTRPTTWPDDLMKVIQIVVGGSGSLWVRAVQTSRADHGTIQQFVEVLRERIQASINADMAITPYQAVSLLLHGIEAEMPSFVQAYLINFDQEVIKTMKMNRFMELCDAVQDMAIYTDLISPAVAPKPPPASRSSTPRSQTCNRWPREGQSFADHLAYWLDRGKGKNGKCPYCLESDHDDTNDCPYLVTKKRKGHWRKQTDLWIQMDYKDRKSFKRPNRPENPSHYVYLPRRL